MSHERAATSEEALARFAATIELESLPSPVIQKLKALILDSIGVSLAGAGAPGVDAVIRAVRGWGGTPESTVFAHGMRVAAPFAALANGVMATARDFDDTLGFVDASTHMNRTATRFNEFGNPGQANVARLNKYRERFGHWLLLGNCAGGWENDHILQRIGQ